MTVEGAERLKTDCLIVGNCVDELYEILRQLDRLHGYIAAL